MSLFDLQITRTAASSLVLAALFGNLAPALAAPPAFDVARISGDIKILASDEFEGRGPATRAEKKTIDYVAKQMAAAGLDSAGSKGGWLQDVQLRQSDIVGPMSLAMTIGGTSTPLVQGSDIAVRAAATGQTSVNFVDLPLVFVGYGVKAPERDWDDFKGADLRNKIMVVLVNDPDFEGGEGAFDGKSMTYYGRWTYKYEEAARQGAAGVLVIHEYAPASYGWPTVKNSNTNTILDIVRADPCAAHTPMEGWIQKDLAVKLLATSGIDLDAAKAAARRKDFRPVPLAATMSVSYAVKSEIITSHNVAGIVRGSKYPEETVIYSAHWDHLGIGAPDASGDTIFNGARDNASGVAALLELARSYGKGARPERSVLFLALTAEETGLLGSEYYADNPLRPLATTAAVINIDEPFGLGKATDFSILGTAKLDLLTTLTEEGGKLGRHYTPDANPEAGLFYRSDHFSMAKRGVPAISYMPGRDLMNGGIARGVALREAHVRDRYHQPADEYDVNWDTGSWADDMTLLYNVGKRLADGKVWPNWSTDSEFRAVRDASAADRK